MVQEPFSNRSKIISQPNSVQRYAYRGLARAAIYVRKGTPAWYMEALSDRDTVTAQVKVNNQDVLLVSAYMDINNETLETTMFANIFDIAEDRGLGVIIGKDSNWHSTFFGPV